MATDPAPHVPPENDFSLKTLLRLRLRTPPRKKRMGVELGVKVVLFQLGSGEESSLSE